MNVKVSESGEIRLLDMVDDISEEGSAKALEKVSCFFLDLVKAARLETG